MNKKKSQDSWTFTLNDCHPSLNAWTRMHFHVRNNLKKEWEQMTFYAAKEAKVPKIDFPIEIFITYYHPKKTVDLDNLVPKFILDGLKNFIVNDNIQWLTKLGWTIKTGDKSSVVEIKRSILE